MARSRRGEDGHNIAEQVNTNTVHIGSAFLPQTQAPTVTSSLPGGAAVTANRMRSYRGYGTNNMILLAQANDSPI